LHAAPSGAVAFAFACAWANRTVLGIGLGGFD
jgi:hypothetical protein